MVVNICRWVVTVCMAVLLSGCGGGDGAPDEIQAPAQTAETRDVQASVSFQVSEQTVSMHGGGASIIDAARERIATRVLESRPSEPEIADDEARERMALTEVEFEQSFSIEMNRQHAEGRSLEEAAELVQQAYVPHEE